MQSGDPTMDFLASLDTPGKWVKRENVPIFEPHVRKFTGPDGNEVTVTVTEADLPTIAENMRRIEADNGSAARLTAGHVRTDIVDERHQPTLIGFARYASARVGTYGPKNKPAILVTEYVYPDKEGLRNSLPFRSPDYYPAQKVIRGVAALLRDPWLDMGVVGYSADRQPHYYASEVPTMAEPTAPAEGTPTPDEQAQMDGLMSKYLKYACAKYNLQPVPAAPAAGTPAAVPEPVRMQLDQMRVSYEHQIGQLKAVTDRQTTELAALRYEREQAVCERQVIQLDAEGYQIGDRAKMVSRLAKMSEADRTAELDHIRLCYARVPVGRPGDLPLTPLPGTEGGGAAQRQAEETHQKAMDHMRANPGVQYEAAVAAVSK